MLSLNRIETRSLATATALVLLGTGVRLGFGPGPADTEWQPPSDTEFPAASAAGLRATVEEGVRREERAGVPIAAGERLDPNFADETELRRLPGIGPAKASAIVRDRRENGPFGSLEDMERVAGLGEKTVSRLAPYLALTSLSPASLSAHGRLDLNRAGLEDLVQLPGIGAELAGRIVEFRQRSGGFRELDDLLAVPGIGPGIVEKIRNQVRIQ
ncbi:MAG: ComEA family DNA-binding protein [Gemmatimonadetes bacterium]|nr:ComEA family DNA-binding protein [Gemmatimonadota bacterium]